jgi:hypothetical protein
VTCSSESERVGEQRAGTAPYAVAWVALEQNGPWGAKAFTASHLDPVVGKEIESRAAAYGVRASLIRRPGRHADEHQEGSRRLLVAHTTPQRTWLAEGCIDSPQDVLDLDWAALADGDASAFGFLERTDRPHLLVCTNGTRDVCCATRGRPVAAAAFERRPDQVWEVTHTSGHRFAPTAVLLPFGTLHGRIADGVGLLDSAQRGQTVLAGSRGRSTWPAAGQVAELAVRAETGELSLDALTVTGSGGDWSVEHVDGRRWQVTTRVEETGLERAESCGKALVPLAHVASEVRPTPGAAR